MREKIKNIISPIFLIGGILNVFYLYLMICRFGFLKSRYLINPTYYNLIYGKLRTWIRSNGFHEIKDYAFFSVLNNLNSYHLSSVYLFLQSIMFLGILFLLVWYGKKKKYLKSDYIYFLFAVYFLLRFILKIISYKKNFLGFFAYYSLFFPFEELVLFVFVIIYMLFKHKIISTRGKNNRVILTIILLVFVIFVCFDTLSAYFHSLTLREEKKMTMFVYSNVEKIKEGAAKKKIIKILGAPILEHKYKKDKKDSVGRLIDEELQYIAFFCYEDYKNVLPFKHNKYKVKKIVFYFYKNKLIEIGKPWPPYFSDENRFIIHNCFNE